MYRGNQLRNKYAQRRRNPAPPQHANTKHMNIKEHNTNYALSNHCIFLQQQSRGGGPLKRSERILATFQWQNKSSRSEKQNIKQSDNSTACMNGV